MARDLTATPIRRTNPVMGTWASIHVHDEAPPATVDDAIDGVFAELARLEDIFSTFRRESEISRFNRGEIDLGPRPATVGHATSPPRWRG